MFNVLISGRLTAAPERRTSKAGNAFVSTKAMVPAGDGETVWTSIVAFTPEAQEALVKLAAGDTVSIIGTAKAGAYINKSGEPKASLSVVADRVMSAYEVSRRKAATSAPAKTAPQRDPLEDDLPPWEVA